MPRQANWPDWLASTAVPVMDGVSPSAFPARPGARDDYTRYDGDNFNLEYPETVPDSDRGIPGVIYSGSSWGLWEWVNSSARCIRRWDLEEMYWLARSSGSVEMPLPTDPAELLRIMRTWNAENRPAPHRGRDYYTQRQRAMMQKGEKHGSEFMPMISKSPSYVAGYNRGVHIVYETAVDLEYQRGYEDGKARKPNAANATIPYLNGHRSGWNERGYQLERERVRNERSAASRNPA